MHRSRLSVLVIFAAAAACSTHDDSNGNAILSRDSSLVARLDVKEARQPLPDACGTVAVAAQPAAADKRQADEMTRQAYDAEILGKVTAMKVQEARDGARIEANNIYIIPPNQSLALADGHRVEPRRDLEEV